MANAKNVLVIFLFAMLAGVGFSQIHVSATQAGQYMSILVEGAQNGTVEIELPDGTVANVSLVDGQAEFLAEQEGRHVITFNGEEKAVVVSAEEGAQYVFPKTQAGEVHPLIILAGVGFAVVILASLYAIWYFLIKQGRNVPRLSKTSIGNATRVEFCASHTEIRNLAIMDGKRKILSRKKLMPMEKVSVEFGEKIDIFPYATYEAGGMKYSISCQKAPKFEGKAMRKAKRKKKKLARA